MVLIYSTLPSQATGIIMEMWGIAVEPEMEDDYKDTAGSCTYECTILSQRTFGKQKLPLMGEKSPIKR